jgi:hypothetical protein
VVRWEHRQLVDVAQLDADHAKALVDDQAAVERVDRLVESELLKSRLDLHFPRACDADEHLCVRVSDRDTCLARQSLITGCPPNDRMCVEENSHPATPLVSLEEVLTPDLDMVLIMTVNPGFGGQSYIPGATAKIARLRQMLDERGLFDIDLEVDGGVKPENAAGVVAAGANVLVAGSAVYNDKASVADNITALRKAIATA